MFPSFFGFINVIIFVVNPSGSYSTFFGADFEYPNSLRYNRSSRSELRYFNFKPSLKLWWCRAQDFDGSQILVTSEGCQGFSRRFLRKTRNSFKKWPLNLCWISNKTIMKLGNITKAATFKSFLHLCYKKTQLLFFVTVLFNISLRQISNDDFWGLHKNMNCAFPLSFEISKLRVSVYVTIFNIVSNMNHC